MIFSKPFESIEFEDVRRTVYDDKVGENIVLDYKRDIPANEKLAELISAFANTHGGIIIFGVECEKNTNKPKRIQRLNVGDVNLEDKLEQISMSSIEPPVLGLRCRELKREDGKQRVFLVQVPESDLTPHAVDNNSTVYIRVNSHKKKFIDKADLSRQAWLLDRRKRHIEFRDRLVTDSKERRTAVCGNLADGEVCVETVLIPFYPHSHLRDIADMDSFVNNVRIQLSKRHPNNIFILTERTPYHGGACYYYKDEHVRYYLDVGTYGLYRSAVILPKEGEPPNCVSPVSVGHSLQFIVGAGLEMLEQLDYHGSLSGTLSISNIGGSELWQSPSLEFVAIHGERPLCNLEKHLQVETVFFPGNYWSQKDSALVEFFGRLAHLYGAVGDLDAYGRSILERTQKSFVRKSLAQ